MLIGKSLEKFGIDQVNQLVEDARKASDLKTEVLQGTVGSNPTSSVFF